ncbi:MAG: hypothetical protein OXF98_10430 [Rhodospirillaceae bacterium]|nr:hypothetical protein [Rhodospirillaceae bacterium]
MNFRVFAAGVVLIVVYQLAIAAVVVWFVVHCEAARGEPVHGCEPIGTAAGSCG